MTSAAPSDPTSDPAADLVRAQIITAIDEGEYSSLPLIYASLEVHVRLFGSEPSASLPGPGNLDFGAVELDGQRLATITIDHEVDDFEDPDIVVVAALPGEAEVSPSRRLIIAPADLDATQAELYALLRLPTNRFSAKRALTAARAALIEAA